MFSTALLSRLRECLFKAKNAERGDTLERFSISSAASQLNSPRSSLSAVVHQPAKPSAVLCIVRSDRSLKFGPASLTFGSLHFSFSLTYLRHSVSAQADYCPDVVGLLFSAAPFIAATIQQQRLQCSVAHSYNDFFSVV